MQRAQRTIQTTKSQRVRKLSCAAPWHAPSSKRQSQLTPENQRANARFSLRGDTDREHRSQIGTIDQILPPTPGVALSTTRSHAGNGTDVLRMGGGLGLPPDWVCRRVGPALTPAHHDQHSVVRPPKRKALTHEVKISIPPHQSVSGGVSRQTDERVDKTFPVSAALRPSVPLLGSESLNGRPPPRAGRGPWKSRERTRQPARKD